MHNQTLMTGKEAAEYAGISYHVFAKMVNAGVIPIFSSMGKRNFYSKSQIDNVLSSYHEWKEKDGTRRFYKPPITANSMLKAMNIHNGWTGDKQTFTIEVVNGKVNIREGN